MSTQAEGRKLQVERMAANATVEANPLGQTWFVDSANGNDVNPGYSPRHALQTLTQAIALAAAGDTIILQKGGSETVTASLAVAVAGLKIICKCDNPEQGFTISGAGTLALMTVSAADCHVEGLKFAHTGATGSAAGILTTAAADRLVVKNCVFDDSAITTTFTGLGLSIIDAVNAFVVSGCIFKDVKFCVKYTIATGVSQIGSLIEKCTFYLGKSAAFGVASALTGTGAVKNAVVRNNLFIESNGDGSPATTAWDGTSGANATQGPIKFEAAVDQYVIEGNTAFTALSDNFENINAINAGAVGLKANNRTGTGTSAGGAPAAPTADSTANATMADAVGNKTDASVNAVGTTKSIIAYVKGCLTNLIKPSADGTANATPADVIGDKTDAAVVAVGTTKSLMAYLKGLVKPIGSQFAVSINVTSSAIPNNTQTSADFCVASGNVMVEDIILETDATGIAGPTNIEISTDNAKGLTGAGAPSILQAVSALGANKTVVCRVTSTTKAIPLVLETGKKLFIHGDDLGGSGAGVTRITLVCRRLSAEGSIVAGGIGS